MATLARAPIEMPTQAENTNFILGAITRLGKETGDAIGCLRKDTTEGLGAINVTVAGLRADVVNLQASQKTLSEKMDRIDDVKAARADLSAVETRIEKTLAEMKSQVRLDLGQIDKDKIGHDQFSIDSFDNLITRLGTIDEKLEHLNEFRWKVIGSYGGVAAVFGVLGYILSLLLHR